MPLISAKQVAKTNPTTATPSVKPQVRRLKKGELLFAESENSSWRGKRPAHPRVQ